MVPCNVVSPFDEERIVDSVMEAVVVFFSVWKKGTFVFFFYMLKTWTVMSFRVDVKKACTSFMDEIMGNML